MNFTDTVADDTMARQRSTEASKAIAAIILVLSCAMMVWLLYAHFGPPSRLGRITSVETEFIKLGVTEESVVATIGRARTTSPQRVSQIFGRLPATSPIQRHVYIMEHGRLFVIEYQNGRVLATFDPENTFDNRFRRPPSNFTPTPPMKKFDPLAL